MRQTSIRMPMNDTDTSTVCRCNRIFGERTLHPLASVIDLSRAAQQQELSLDCYAVMVAGRVPGCRNGTLCSCDYADATVLFAPPGHHIEAQGEADSRLLLFHPDLTSLDSLGMKMPEYTYFGYNKSEALRLSLREKRQVERCLDYIDEELHWGIDRFSRILLCNKIELLLNYCLRFYARQFILRHDIISEDIAKVTEKIDIYLRSGRAAATGLPGAQLVAQWAGHSQAYTSDMLHAETGHTTEEYVQKRRFEMAKQMLIGTESKVSEIAATLGFPSTPAFTMLFEKCTGCTPNEYRNH